MCLNNSPPCPKYLWRVCVQAELRVQPLRCQLLNHDLVLPKTP